MRLYKFSIDLSSGNVKSTEYDNKGKQKQFKLLFECNNFQRYEDKRCFFEYARTDLQNVLLTQTFTKNIQCLISFSDTAIIDIITNCKDLSNEHTQRSFFLMLFNLFLLEQANNPICKKIVLTFLDKSYFKLRISDKYNFTDFIYQFFPEIKKVVKNKVAQAKNYFDLTYFAITSYCDLSESQRANLIFECVKNNGLLKYDYKHDQLYYIAEGVNGCLYPAHDLEDLTDKIMQVTIKQFIKSKTN